MQLMCRAGPPFLLALLLAGCAAPVNVEYNRTSYTTWHTFSWQTPTDVKVESPILDSGILTIRVEKAVEETLQDAGYHLTSNSQNADFIVTYHTAMQLRNEPQSGIGIGFSSGTYGPGCNISFLTQPDAQQAADRAVQRIFGEFPPPGA